MDVRIVSADQLRAMCDRASGTAHTFALDMGKTRATITYSNPDEYGSARPFALRLPIIQAFGAPQVVLQHASEAGPGLDEHDRDACYQAVDAAVLSAPDLYPVPDSSDWETMHERLQRKGDALANAMPRGYVVDSGRDILAGDGRTVATVGASLDDETVRVVARVLAMALNRELERMGVPTAAEERARAEYRAAREAAGFGG